MFAQKNILKNTLKNAEKQVFSPSILQVYFTSVQRESVVSITISLTIRGALMNEHRLYIVLGLLLLVMGALAVRRRDPIGSAAFLIAGTGAVANGVNALRKRITPQISPQMMRLRLGLLIFGIVAAMVLILLEEGLERFGG